MSQKYGKEIAYRNIELYIATGNSDFITRDNNLRRKVENSTMKEDIKRLLKERDINLKQYIMEMDLGTINESLLIEAIEESNKRFNGNGIGQVKAYLKTGREDYLTRNNNMREKVINSSLRNDVLEKLKKENITFEEYIEQIMPNQNISKK